MAAGLLLLLLGAAPTRGAEAAAAPPCRYDNDPELVDSTTRVWRRLSTQMAILRQVPSQSASDTSEEAEPLFPSGGFEDLDVNSTFRFEMGGFVVRDTWLAKFVEFGENGTWHFNFSEGGRRRLRLFLVDDASVAPAAGANECALSLTSPGGNPIVFDVTRLCQATPPDTIACQAGVVRALLEEDASDSALLFMLAHELGHLLLRGHESASYDRYTLVRLDQPRQQKVNALRKLVCVDFYNDEAVRKEHQADAFAMRVVALGGDLLAALDQASRNLGLSGNSSQVDNQCKAERQGLEVLSRVASAMKVWQQRQGLLQDPLHNRTELVRNALCRCEGVISWPALSNEHPPPGVRVARLYGTLQRLGREEVDLASWPGQRPILTCATGLDLTPSLRGWDLLLPAAERESRQYDDFLQGLCGDLNLAREGELFPECNCPAGPGG